MPGDLTTQASTWRLFVYRKLSEVDMQAAEAGEPGLKRFEAMSGEEEQMRSYFQDFAGNQQVLAVELLGPNGRVELRRDSLLDLVGSLRSAPQEPMARLAWRLSLMALIWERTIGPDVKIR